MLVSLFYIVVLDVDGFLFSFAGTQANNCAQELHLTDHNQESHLHWTWRRWWDFGLWALWMNETLENLGRQWMYVACRNNLNHSGPVNRLWGTDYKMAFHNSFLLVYTPLYISFPLVVSMPKWKACCQSHSNHGMYGTNIHLTCDCIGKWTRKNYMEHSQGS